MNSSDEDEFNLQTHDSYESDFLSDTRNLFTKDPDDSSTRTAIIRTSDRITFRRCRRKWNWSYSGRHNLRPRAEPAPFWLGSGMHFSLEDFHGYHHFTHPRDALSAYYEATLSSGIELPSDVEEMLDLGQGMMDYYCEWLKDREPLNTLWINNAPEVEVNVHIEIPKEDLLRVGCPQEVLDLYDRILYSATLDRVIIDSYKRLWLLEYKSAKQFLWHHLDTDQQVTSYAWIMSLKYPEYEIAGCVYQQHKKQILAPPQFLSSTKLFSTSKRQKTSYAMYSGALRNLYGNSQSNWPEPNRQFLQYLQTQEAENQDILIKRDFIERNNHQIHNEYQKILLEVSEMLDPNLRIYPNPTRDCAWDCPFNLACVHFDSGADWEYELNSRMMSRSGEGSNWRKYLKLPQPSSDIQFSDSAQDDSYDKQY